VGRGGDDLGAAHQAFLRRGVVVVQRRRRGADHHELAVDVLRIELAPHGVGERDLLHGPRRAGVVDPGAVAEERPGMDRARAGQLRGDGRKLRNAVERGGHATDGPVVVEGEVGVADADAVPLEVGRADDHRLAVLDPCRAEHEVRPRPLGRGQQRRILVGDARI